MASDSPAASIAGHEDHGEPRKRPRPRGTAAYPRKRAVTACQVCRARRTKCDNRKPSCSFCLRIGATCVQSPVDLSSFDPASLKILERLDDLERLLIAPSAVNPNVVPPQADTFPGDDDTEVASAPDRRSGGFLPVGADEILRWPFFAQAVHHSQSPENLHSELAGSHASSPAVVSDDDLTSESVGTLVEAFFANVHVKNPVLDENVTRRLVSRMTLHGFDASAESCLALLVCALGSVSSSFNVEESVQLASPSYRKAMSYFQAAQKRIGPLMIVGGILPTQCLFLSGVFMATVFNLNAAWRCFAQALMCCQSFTAEAGINTDGHPHPDLLSPEQQAIYWSAWKSEREMRIILKHQDFLFFEAGMYPPFYPTPPSTRQADETQQRDRMTQREESSWFFYLSEISLRRLSTRITQEILEIARKRNGSNAIAVLVESVSEWELQIQQWTNGLSDSMSLGTPDERYDTCKWVLHGQLLNLYELIYWPFLQEVIASCPNCNSESLAADVYRLANKALEIHDQGLEMNHIGMHHRHHGTIFMMHTCTRSALLLLYVAAEQGKQSTTSKLILPPTWLNGARAALSMNRYWQAESADARRWAHCIQAILDQQHR